MSSDGWTLRRDHKDALFRLSAELSKHRAYDSEQDIIQELEQDPSKTMFPTKTLELVHCAFSW